MLVLRYPSSGGEVRLGPYVSLRDMERDLNEIYSGRFLDKYSFIQELKKRFDVVEVDDSSFLINLPSGESVTVAVNDRYNVVIVDKGVTAAVYPLTRNVFNNIKRFIEEYEF